MRRMFLAAAAASILTVASAGAALADRDGGNGGDREPAGGAFNSSYPEPGSTGTARGGPPRSVDIPRPPYGQVYDPEATGSTGYAEPIRRRTR